MGPQRVLDERNLGLVAEISDAQLYTAESADELLEVFSTIPLETENKQVRMELSALLPASSARRPDTCSGDQPRMRHDSAWRSSPASRSSFEPDQRRARACWLA